MGKKTSAQIRSTRVTFLFLATTNSSFISVRRTFNNDSGHLFYVRKCWIRHNVEWQLVFAEYISVDIFYGEFFSFSPQDVGTTDFRVRSESRFSEANTICERVQTLSLKRHFQNYPKNSGRELLRSVHTPCKTIVSFDLKFTLFLDTKIIFFHHHPRRKTHIILTCFVHSGKASSCSVHAQVSLARPWSEISRVAASGITAGINTWSRARHRRHVYGSVRGAARKSDPARKVFFFSPASPYAYYRSVTDLGTENHNVIKHTPTKNRHLFRYWYRDVGG